MPDARAAALSCSGLAKSFAGVRVLEDVSFDFEPGTVNILAGENGAGKSTILKIISGQERPDAGSVAIFGSTVTHFDPRYARRLGVGIVPQELAPILDMPVYANLFLGREIRGRSHLLDHGEMVRRARQMLEVFELDIDPRVPMRYLSVASMQLIEIVKTTTSGARVLLLDEPTSAIPEREVEALFGVVAKLKAQGVVVVYTTHRMAEIEGIGDRVVVLRDGRLVLDRPVPEITETDIVRAMIGRSLGMLFPEKALVDRETQPVLQVRELQVEGRPAVDLTVRPGEIVGLGGLVGAGRSELLEGIFGIRSSAGEVRVNGRGMPLGDPSAAIAEGVCFVPEDRKTAGLVLSLPVLENGAIPNLGRFTGPFGWFRRHLAEKVVTEVAESTRLTFRSLNQLVETLSGGNQQKLVLAKWLTRDVAVLLLDEPTRGVDIGARSEIYRVIAGLAKRGVAVLMVSSDLEELLGLSHRVLVMRRGALTGELGPSEVNSPEAQERVLRLATGMDIHAALAL